MKKIFLIFVLFTNFLTTSLPKKESFIENVKTNYSEYYLEEMNLVVGDLVICYGRAPKLSLSVYFQNKNEKAYSLRIVKNNKTYQIDEKSDQIYYDIQLDDKSKYKIELISSKTKDVYFVKEIDFDVVYEKGQGANDFLYQTKLKNYTSKFFKIIIISIVVIALEGAVLVVILTLKHKKQKMMFDSELLKEKLYMNVVEEIKDDENETC